MESKDHDMTDPAATSKTVSDWTKDVHIEAWFFDPVINSYSRDIVTPTETIPGKLWPCARQESPAEVAIPSTPLLWLPSRILLRQLLTSNMKKYLAMVCLLGGAHKNGDLTCVHKGREFKTNEALLVFQMTEKDKQIQVKNMWACPFPTISKEKFLFDKQCAKLFVDTQSILFSGTIRSQERDDLAIYGMVTQKLVDVGKTDQTDFSCCELNILVNVTELINICQ